MIFYAPTWPEPVGCCSQSVIDLTEGGSVRDFEKRSAARREATGSPTESHLVAGSVGRRKADEQKSLGNDRLRA